MFLRLALTFAVLFCAAKIADAAVVQVEFTAELESSSLGFDPLTIFSGFFRYDDSEVRHSESDFLGTYSHTELIDFGLQSPLGATLVNTGLVTEYSTSNSSAGVINGPAVNNGPMSNAPSFAVHIGTAVYPSPVGQANIIPFDFEVLYDFDDSVELLFDFPYVPSPVLSLTINLEEEGVLFDGTHSPLVLSQSRNSNLIFNYQGQTASYLITSLQIVPEPTSLLLLSIASAFWVGSRRRV